MIARSTFLVCVVSCQSPVPAGQIALQIDTDAIVPPAPVPGLFDALRVDVYEPGATTPCALCGRVFSVTSTQFKKGEVTFGLPLRPGVAGYRARLRLYPSRATRTGDPPDYESAVIEKIVALPAVGEDGIALRRVRLFTEDIGAPQGTLEEPVETEPGRYPSSLVNSWSGAARVPCQGLPREGEVCVPGGAFFMGNVLAMRGFVVMLPVPSAVDATRLRLVRLSPFFIDADNATVGDFRAAKQRPDGVRTFGGGDVYTDFCTYRDLGDDDLPINCLLHATARDYCETQGKKLVSEAQFEYVASALEGRFFVWGDDPEVRCEDVVVGRVGWGIYSSTITYCRPSQPIGGPLPVGSKADPPRRDRLELEGGTVYDLAGNMGTVTADRWNRQTEECWNHGGVYVDPVCASSSSEDGPNNFADRGGGWTRTFPAPAAGRDFTGPFAVSVSGGVRCARPDE